MNTTELAELARAAGLVFPAAYQDQILAGAAGLKEAAAKMRGAAREPAHVFVVDGAAQKLNAAPRPSEGVGAEAKPLHELTIPEAGALLRCGEISSVQLTEAALERIEALDPVYHAFITVTADRALADAAAADADFAKGVDTGPMQGIPYALKDLIDTAGIRTTAHSRLFENHVPDRDAVVARRLREAGGVLLGKLATYEFAVVGPSFDLPFPSAVNPWNVEHITGGSSSGSASAVAGGLVRTAIGTDTGGSVRSPACYCGVVGLKPTYGSVSRGGVFPLSWSLDHVGPVSATVAEAAITLDAIAEPSRALAASSGIGQHVERMRVAYARNWHANDSGLLPAIAALLDQAAEKLSSLGVDIQEVELPDYQLMEDCGAVILQAEAYAIHEHNLKTRGGEYGRLAYQSLASGFALSAADLLQAQRLRGELARQMDAVLGGCDALMTASVLSTAPAFAEFDGTAPRWTAMRTLPFNLTGHPALALPIGFVDGLPAGMQLIGKYWDEATICRLGHAYEEAAGWTRMRPGVPQTNR
jgi:aspartyl-tRNA(Asn)/glutamyl-tRNA(Gln) amidotransferase subunit A